VLKRDGVLRLSVPDFDLLLEMYARTGKEVGKNMEVMNMALMGGQDSPLNFHRSVFNMESLARLLTQVGFRVTRRWTPEALGSDSFDDWSQKALSVEGMKYPFSLNVEAIK
jgi:predicted SAM-dependent methyltransferase